MKHGAALLSILISACVSQGPQSKIGSEQEARSAIRMQRNSDCAFQSTISDFTVLDERHVVFFGAGRRQAYLAEMAFGCFDVGRQSAVAAVDGDGNGQVCGYGRDSPAYRGLGRLEHCRITALEKLTDERRIALGLSPAPERHAPRDADADEPEEARKPGEPDEPADPGDPGAG